MNNLKKLALFSLTGSVLFAIGCGSNNVMGTADKETNESAHIIFFDDWILRDSITIPGDPGIIIGHEIAVELSKENPTSTTVLPSDKAVTHVVAEIIPAAPEPIAAEATIPVQETQGQNDHFPSDPVIDSLIFD